MGIVKDVCDIGEKVYRAVCKVSEHRKVEAILSVMKSTRKTLRLKEVAILSSTTENKALQALRVLKDRGEVISIDVDEEPKETFWRSL